MYQVYLTMIVRTKNKILVLFLLASHLAVFGLHDVIHNHPILFSGSFEGRIFSHEDADHCRHIPLSDHSECSICLSPHSRIVPDQTSLNLGRLQIVGVTAAVTIPSFIQAHLFESFSRRGPPSLLG